MTWRIITGDCRETMRAMDPESVQCVVTSPPYWGLRDYKLEPMVWGGRPDCEHEWIQTSNPGGSGDGTSFRRDKLAGCQRGSRLQPGTCSKCGAWCGSLRLEPTIDLYLDHVLEVFAEVWRVLRKDGTCWLNIGDSYATGAGKVGACPGGGHRGENWKGATTSPNRMPQDGLKPKDLCLIPFRLALALQAAGWWVRQDNIWHKPNPMPESCKDRPTRAHEYIFLLTKSARYFYDGDAIRESYNPESIDRYKSPLQHTGGKIEQRQPGGEWSPDNGNYEPNPLGCNRRSVWTIPTQAFPDAHFATFPTKLVEPCVKAGTSHEGQCPECGAAWIRETSEPQGGAIGKSWLDHSNDAERGNFKIEKSDGYVPRCTLGWRPSCSCNAGDPVPQTVLDPFSGAGTVGLVAQRLGRDFIGCELNPQYSEMARKRIAADMPLFQDCKT